MGLKLFKIWQATSDNYNIYDGAVVVAKDENAAIEYTLTATVKIGMAKLMMSGAIRIMSMFIISVKPVFIFYQGL